MATHKSAIKRHNQSLKRRMRNRSVKSRLKTATKNVLNKVEEKDLAGAEEALKTAEVLIDRAASKKIIHRNTAARKISRLTRRVNSLAQVS